MVCDWGMSPLGPIAYGGEPRHGFPRPRDFAQRERVSEETARRIDVEIQQAHRRAVRAGEEHHQREAVPRWTRLPRPCLQYETIEGRHVLEILEFGEIRSPIAVAFFGKLTEKPEEKKAADKPAAEGLGAGGPAPAPTPA
jgi:cell division protease FtsH